MSKTLARTYGLLLFFEQFTEILHNVGNVPLEETERWRRELRKQPATLPWWRDQFLAGVADVDASDLADVFEQLCASAADTASRAHAVTTAENAMESARAKLAA